MVLVGLLLLLGGAFSGGVLAGGAFGGSEGQLDEGWQGHDGRARADDRAGQSTPLVVFLIEPGMNAVYDADQLLHIAFGEPENVEHPPGGVTLNRREALGVRMAPHPEFHVDHSTALRPVFGGPPAIPFPESPELRNEGNGVPHHLRLGCENQPLVAASTARKLGGVHQVLQMVFDQ